MKCTQNWLYCRAAGLFNTSGTSNIASVSRGELAS
jgi:hypothetical protein